MQKLNEGMRPLELKDLVSSIFEVDNFKSKMGEDHDVCVINFVVKDRFPAKDLMEFIEKGYGFVLDADVSSGENNNGEYTVFVELQRTPKLAEEIQEIMYGLKKITGIEDWKFRYHKNNEIYPVREETVKSIVPLDPDSYKGMLDKIKVESLKKFFNKTLMDDLSLEKNIITIHKPFDKKISLKWLNEDDVQPVIEGATDVDSESIAEIFWLTKVLGDYNISKFGDRFLFTNGDRTMLLQRTEL